VVGWMLGDPSMPDRLRQEQIPCFGDPLRALKAIRSLISAPLTMQEEILEGDVDGALVLVTEALRNARYQLGEYESKQLLSLLGISVTQGNVAKNPEHAVVIAEEVGYPVVLKIESRDIGHKSEAGGVRLGVETPLAVASAFEDIQNSVESFDPNAVVDGIGVYKMVPGAIELIAGVKRDPVFGPVILVGSGGIMVEMLHDSVVRVAPITKSDAYNMIAELKTYPLLKGARGHPKCDIDAIADTLVRLSSFALAAERISELDINPLMVLSEGAGVCAADALIALQD